MTDTSKLSVSKTLKKLRGTEEPKSKMARLDDKTDDQLDFSCLLHRQVGPKSSFLTIAF